MTRGLLSGVIPFSSVDGPGNRFVAFLQGCNFDCIACHNPYTIDVCNDCGECVAQCPSGALALVDGRVRWDERRCTGTERCIAWCPYESTPKARSVGADELVEMVRGPAPFLSGVTVSGGEATLQARFVHAFFTALRDDTELAHLTRFVDSNGAATDHVWDLLEPVMDAAMIDLKCLDDSIHRMMTGQSNDTVLASIERLARHDRLHEVRLLVLPGVNDAPDLLARTAAWLAAVDPDMRVKVIGFRCHGVRPIERELREPAAEDMAAYSALLQREGLHRLTLV